MIAEPRRGEALREPWERLSLAVWSQKRNPAGSWISPLPFECGLLQGKKKNPDIVIEQRDGVAGTDTKALLTALGLALPRKSLLLSFMDCPSDQLDFGMHLYLRGQQQELFPRSRKRWLAAVSDARQQKACPDERTDRGDKENCGTRKGRASVGGKRRIWNDAFYRFGVAYRVHKLVLPLDGRRMFGKRRQVSVYSFTKFKKMFQPRRSPVDGFSANRIGALDEAALAKQFD